MLIELRLSLLLSQICEWIYWLRYTKMNFYISVIPNLAWMDGMVNMEKSEDQDRKIVLEFCHLLEKSKQLFNGLR